VVVTSGRRRGRVRLPLVEARNVPFFVLSLLYLWPLMGEVLGGVKKTRGASLRGGRASST